MKKEETIRQVWERKKTKQLMISIPNNVGIKAGDFVKVKKIKV